MKFSLFKPEDGKYSYYEGDTYPEFKIDDSFMGNFGFFPLEGIKIFPQSEVTYQGSGEMPQGAIVTDFYAGDDPLLNLLLFAGKIWLVWQLIGK